MFTTRSVSVLFTALLALGACSKSEDPAAHVKRLGDRVCATTDYATGRPAWQEVVGYISDNQDNPALKETSRQLGLAIIDHSDAAATGDLKRIIDCALKTGAF